MPGLSANPYGPEQLAADLHVPRGTLDNLQLYADALIKWQQAKNLVAKGTLDDLWRRHMLDSAQLAPLIQADASVPDRPTLMDFGSGAGFPALVLAIMGVAEVRMVESNGRKAAFLRHVSRQTGAGAAVLNERIEALPPTPMDVMTARACASLDQLLAWAEPHITPTTVFFFLKGQTADEELTMARASWNMRVDRFDSLSDSGGVVLKLSGVSRLNG